MAILTEDLRDIRRRIIQSIVLFLGIALSLLVLTSRECSLFGKSFNCLVPGSPSIAQQLFQLAQNQLIPPNVQVIALEPVSLFLAPILIALLVALFAVFPFLMSQLIGFLRPALYTGEHRVLLSALFFSAILFYAGGGFALTVIIPKTYALLYTFSNPLGIVPYFALDQFLSTTILLTLATGIVFLLPVAMVLATRLRLIPASFWHRQWRGALLGTLIFSAIVTPDGSGITMFLLALPMFILYGTGAVFASTVRSLV